jgi:hypothetical protein
VQSREDVISPFDETEADAPASPSLTSPARPKLAAGEASADAPLPVRRPSLGRFLWYCFGGTLPPENHTWVLHDVTCRTWALRHFARWTMVIAPLFLLYLAFMPMPLGTRVYTGITFSLAIYVMSFVFILIDTDRRAVRAGYDHSLPQAMRATSSTERQRAANHARRERIAQRRHRGL